MKITLTGASGFIGSHLVEKLEQAGHELHALGRHPVDKLSFTPWDSSSGAEPADASLVGADALVHLAGAPVATRWTPEVKRNIRDSRVNGTRALVHALSTQSHRPRVLVSASAIGYYGDRGDEALTENSPAGTGFLAALSKDWEHEALLARSLGIRVVIIRIGIVLGKEGGALARMLTPFRMGAGGRLGSGQQWMSWIHVQDIVGLIQVALDEANAAGPINGTAPNPVTNAVFTAELGKALHRPAIFPAPRFALKAMFGEMADVLLTSQRVIPQAAQQLGYRFQFPDLPQALADLV
jgi:uncharacterized protein (TIGR01777 family)